MFLQTLVATTLCVIGVALAQHSHSPVFLWGAKAPSYPALHTVTRSEFETTIAGLLKDHMVVAFQEEALGPRDLLCASSATSDSCYAHLQGITTKTYYASVEDPIEAVRSVAQTKEHNSVSDGGELATPITCAKGKAVFVTFDGHFNESREALLDEHDSAIESISKSLDCPTVYLYLAASSSGTPRRIRREISDTAAPYGGTYFRQGSQFLIFYTELLLSKPSAADTQITITSMTVTNSSSGANFSVALATSDAKSVDFTISLLSDGYYLMSNIVYDGVTYRVAGVNAPLTFSYHCGNLTVQCISTDCNTALKWNSLQFQAPFGYTTNTSFAFGDSWDCVPFFSPAILMGLFVIILLLSITFVGICWMMDINTMDRFDDPKGKTITINASD